MTGLRAKISIRVGGVKWRVGFFLLLTSLKTEFLLIRLNNQLAKIHNSSLDTCHSDQNLGFKSCSIIHDDALMSLSTSLTEMNECWRVDCVCCTVVYRVRTSADRNDISVHELLWTHSQHSAIRRQVCLSVLDTLWYAFSVQSAEHHFLQYNASLSCSLHYFMVHLIIYCVWLAQKEMKWWLFI